MSNFRALWSIPKIGKGPRTHFSHVQGKTQGGHKPGKHRKPEKLMEFENCQNLREKTQEKFEFLWKKPRKLREMENM